MHEYAKTEIYSSLPQRGSSAKKDRKRTILFECGNEKCM